MYTKPEKAVGIFETPSLTGDFDFVRAAFGEEQATLITPSRNQHEWLFRHYTAKENSENDDDSTKRFGPRIAHFISSVKGDADSYSEIDPNDLNDLSINGSCLVFARTERKAKKRRGSDKITDLIAVYSSQDLRKDTGEKKIQEFWAAINSKTTRASGKKEIGAALQFLISTLENLERRDLDRLQTEVFNLISSEIPEFADPRSEPSFLIHNITNEIQKICNRNPLTGSTQVNRSDVNISYISLDFVESRSQREITPRLSIFPSFGRAEASSSIRFSHPFSRSICKHLVGKWIFDRDEDMQDLPFEVPQSSILASSFRDTFDTTIPLISKEIESLGDRKRNKEEQELYSSLKYFTSKNRSSAESDVDERCTVGIYATACREFVKQTHNKMPRLAAKTFWGRHNFPLYETLNQDESAKAFASDNHTTLAFLLMSKICGDPDSTPDENVPFGILAFESPQLDAFSKAEIDIFGTICKAVSKLLTLLNLGSSRIDYSSKIRIAMSGAGEINERINYDDFVYEITRVKYDVLEQFSRKTAPPSVKQTLSIFGITADNSGAQGELSHITTDSLYRAFNPLFQSASDPNGELNGTLPEDNSSYDTRQRWLYDSQSFFEYRWLRKSETSSPSENRSFARELVHFLEGLPSNDVWKARLNTVPRALRHRKVTNPRLEKFHGGFSADSVFVLDEKQELKQVLKFSQKSKIWKGNSSISETCSIQSSTRC